MDEFFASMTSEEKKQMMSRMMPKMMEKMMEGLTAEDRQGRYEILQIYTENMPLADDVDLGKLADMTDQYRGVLLWRICQEAAAHALRRTLEKEEITEEAIPQERLEQIRIDMDDFLHAFKSVKPEI